MNKNSTRSEFLTTERKLLRQKAKKELSLGEPTLALDKRIEVTTKEKQTLSRKMLALLISSSSKALNDFLTFNRPSVFYTKKSEKIDDSKNTYMWQFIMTRIEEAYRSSKSELLLEESVGKSLINKNYYSILEGMLKKKFGIILSDSSCFTPTGEQKANFYTVFTFTVA